MSTTCKLGPWRAVLLLLNVARHRQYVSDLLAAGRDNSFRYNAHFRDMLRLMKTLSWAARHEGNKEKPERRKGTALEEPSLFMLFYKNTKDPCSDIRDQKP